MKYPLRNTIYEKVKQAGLVGALEKEDNFVSWPDFDMEIMIRKQGLEPTTMTTDITLRRIN